jgi:hypothetical protein
MSKRILVVEDQPDNRQIIRAEIPEPRLISFTRTARRRVEKTRSELVNSQREER